jgi:hypothetical protein
VVRDNFFYAVSVVLLCILLAVDDQVTADLKPFATISDLSHLRHLNILQVVSLHRAD